jgi:hypothetical protein
MIRLAPPYQRLVDLGRLVYVKDAYNNQVFAGRVESKYRIGVLTAAGEKSVAITREALQELIRKLQAQLDAEDHEDY